MTTPKEHPPAHFYEGLGLREFTMLTAKAIDESPKEAELLHGVVIKAIHGLGPRAHSMGHVELVQAIYGPAMEAMQNSEAGSDALNKIAERAKAAHSEGAKSKIAWIPVLAVGLIGGAVIVGAACIYIAVKY